jgi:MoxR-like ATPase
MLSHHPRGAYRPRHSSRRGVTWEVGLSLDSPDGKRKSITMLSQRIRRLIEALGEGILEKEEALRLMVLAALAGENVFLYGPPGVAKSMLARRLAFAFRDARTFEYLLGRFTTPEEIFGPVSISRLKDADRFERVVDGFLPTAEIAFLDEIWNASSPILNTLLTAINERRFRNGSEELRIPLRTVIGAAGQLVPNEPGLDNLWDRFLLRIRVAPIQSAEAFLSLIHTVGTLEGDSVPPEDKITADELDEWTDARDAVTIPDDVAALILDIRERIARHNSMTNVEENDGVAVSDRRWRQAIRLLRTSALLNDRTEIDALDCAMLRHCLWSRESDIPVVNTIVEEALRRYSVSGRFDPEPMRARFDAILAEVRAMTVATSEEDRAEPIEYRGEYFRVDDFVDDHMALIWIGDFQNLSEEESRDTDLFFYGENDDYAYSERLPIRRIGEYTVEIDGQAFELETRTVPVTIEQQVTPDAEKRSRTTRELEAIRDEAAAVLESIGDYRRRTENEAAAHLFVHRSYAEILRDGMADAEGAFALIRTDVTALLSSLAPDG